MNMNEPPVMTPAVFAAVYQQNWENARHIKSERIWFMNIYSFISAGILSLLHSVKGEPMLQLSLMGFMCAFSIIGLLTSLRLKAELEECLAKIETLVAQAGVEPFVALGDTGRALGRFPKFRWIFPVFYSITTVAFTALLVYRVVTGIRAG
jgi:hypothetical protein